jgi:hypothetical protein
MGAGGFVLPVATRAIREEGRRRTGRWSRGDAVSKKAVWFGMIVGSTIGGWVPSLWHAGMLSIWGIVMSTVGGIAGIWLAYRMTH